MANFTANSSLQIAITENSDSTLRLILDVTAKEQEMIRTHLDAEREAGRIVYGAQESPAALITCSVVSYAGDHLHFIDGSDGGYTRAAQMLKSQTASARLASKQ